MGVSRASGDCYFVVAGFVVDFLDAGVDVDACAVFLSGLNEAGVQVGAVNYPPSVQ